MEQQCKINLDMLKMKIEENHLTVEKLSSKIGINPSTFYRKAQKNGLTFTVGEMHSIARELMLTEDEACTIFLR